MYCVYLAYIASILPPQPLSYPYSLYLIIFCTASILPVQPLSNLYSLCSTNTASVLPVQPLLYKYSLYLTRTASILPVHCTASVLQIQPLSYLYSIWSTHTASVLPVHCVQPLFYTHSFYLSYLYSLCLGLLFAPQLLRLGPRPRRLVAGEVGSKSVFRRPG